MIENPNPNQIRHWGAERRLWSESTAATSPQILPGSFRGWARTWTSWSSTWTPSRTTYPNWPAGQYQSTTTHSSSVVATSGNWIVILLSKCKIICFRVRYPHRYCSTELLGYSDTLGREKSISTSTNQISWELSNPQNYHSDPGVTVSMWFCIGSTNIIRNCATWNIRRVRWHQESKVRRLIN